jgi:hypothetical protein
MWSIRGPRCDHAIRDGSVVTGYVLSGSVLSGDELPWSNDGVQRRDTCRSIIFITERPAQQPPTIGLAVVASSREDFPEGTLVAFRD